MSKFERKYGKYAVKNLSLALILCYVVGYVIQQIAGDFLSFLTLNPYLILRGQIWRLVTWIIVPPSRLDIFTIIMLYFYYSVGTSLERTWGTFRYNVYIFSGILITVIASFLAMGTCYLLYPEIMATGQSAQIVFMAGSELFSTYYINMSILLAFAATFPDVQILLMFIIPIRMKWMGILYGVFLLSDFVNGVHVAGVLGAYEPMFNVLYRYAIAASVLTFLVFFITSRSRIHMTPKQMKRRAEFKNEVRRNRPAVTKHKCAVCGQTDESNADLEFRFCSKCNGNYEYCQNHLFTHEHVK